MCPLMQREDKLLPLKAKPNQTRSVISVTVVFGFKAARLTSDKTSIQSHPGGCARLRPHTHTLDTGHAHRKMACCAAGLRRKSSVSSSKIQAFAIKKPQNLPCTSELTSIVSESSNFFFEQKHNRLSSGFGIFNRLSSTHFWNTRHSSQRDLFDCYK